MLRPPFVLAIALLGVPHVIVAQAPGGAGVVGLGEQAHGHASLNGRKAAVLMELAAEGPVDAIIVESSFTGSVAAQGLAGTTADRMRAFTYPFWLTDTVVQAFAHAEEVSRSGRSAFLWGCDVQEDCRFRTTTLRLIGHPALRPFADVLLRCDTTLDRYIGAGSPRGPMTMADKRSVQDAYSAVMARLDPREQGNALLLRCLENRIALCDLLALKSVRERMALRDSLMAANVLWIRGQLRPEARIVFWAADLHVQRGAPARPPHWCGEYLSQALGDRYTAISVSHQRKPSGRFDRREHVPHAIRPDPRDLVTPCP